MRQLVGLLCERAGLFLRLTEQLVRAQVPLQDFQAHRHQRHQFGEQRVLTGVERMKRGCFDDAQQGVLGQERRRQDLHRRGRPRPDTMRR